MTALKQTQKIKSSGSFFNMLMGNNQSVPKAGEWATIMHYTDRSVVRVHSVSDDGKTVVLEDCFTSAVPGSQMGDQNWTHEPNGQLWTIRYMWGAWQRVGSIIEWEQAILDKARAAGQLAYRWLQENDPETYDKLYGKGEIQAGEVVPGVTREKKTYSKVSILFGEAKYYRDWEF